MKRANEDRLAPIEPLPLPVPRSASQRGRRAVSVAMGNDRGQHVMQHAMDLLTELDVPLDLQVVKMGSKGLDGAVPTSVKRSVESTGLLWMGPYASRATTSAWATFASKRIFRRWRGVTAPHDSAYDVDITLVCDELASSRSSHESMVTPDVVSHRRFLSRAATEQVIRYAFEVARRRGATRLTCAHRDGDAPLMDGLFLRTFRRVARDFGDVEIEERPAARLAMDLILDPTAAEVIVASHEAGDYLGNVCAGLVGGAAFSPVASIGESVCVFAAPPDAYHPAATLISAAMLLRHLGLFQPAWVVEKSLEAALVDARRATPQRIQPAPDLVLELMREHAERLRGFGHGKVQPLQPVEFRRLTNTMHRERVPMQHRHLDGMDVFIESRLDPSTLAERIVSVAPPELKLESLRNRGACVWPSDSSHPDCSDLFVARLIDQHGRSNEAMLLRALAKLADVVRISSVELIYDGAVGRMTSVG